MCKLNQRELCQALGKVIVKVLRTHVSGDTDEVPQRWRSTAYARRQWAAAPTAKDVEHVDHAADEVHEQAQGIVYLNFIICIVYFVVQIDVFFYLFRF